MLQATQLIGFAAGDFLRLKDVRQFTAGNSVNLQTAIPSRPGDWLIVFSIWQEGQSMTTPTDFTELGQDFHNGSPDMGIACWYKKVSGSEGSVGLANSSSNARVITTFLIEGLEYKSAADASDGDFDAVAGDPGNGSVDPSAQDIGFVVGACAEVRNSGSITLSATSDLTYTGATPTATLSELSDADFRWVIKYNFWADSPQAITASSDSFGGLDVSGFGLAMLAWNR